MCVLLNKICVCLVSCVLLCSLRPISYILRYLLGLLSREREVFEYVVILSHVVILHSTGRSCLIGLIMLSPANIPHHQISLLTMSTQFETALRKYIAAYDSSNGVSAAEFKSRFDNLHHKCFTLLLRSKDLLTREEVFELEASKLANDTKVTLVHFKKISLDCVDIKIKLSHLNDEENTTVRFVTAIAADQAVGSREIKDSSLLKMKIDAEQQEAPPPQLPKLLDMITNREWESLSNSNVLTPETLRAAQDDLNENVGSLLHVALRFDAPSSIISQITHAMHSSVLHRDYKDRLPLHIAINKARSSMVSHLIRLNPSACTYKDDKGKLPLHRCFDKKVLSAFKSLQLTKTVEILVNASPETLMVEDQDEMCPIELAILSAAPMETIMFMQHEISSIRQNSS